MAKLIVSIDGVVIREVELSKERTSIGRRPYNDVVIDNLAVSGEHAALVRSEGVFFAEDLNSTNGSYLNGKGLKRERLANGDILEIGKYKIKFIGDEPAPNYDATMVMRPGAAAPVAAAAPAGNALIRVTSGSAAGRDVALTKVVTTIGKPGIAVAAITKRISGYVVAHVDGEGQTLLNGKAIGTEPEHLKSGDTLELAGTSMQFHIE
ncbi:MAG: FHA domain-containing protein [Cellvibrionales bacterium]|nr:MAG: FHA domain-containing protein [Cellvibrionales bacterium]